jgi:hypothetical protein
MAVSIVDATALRSRAAFKAGRGVQEKLFKHHRHPEVLAASRRASKDRPQTLVAILRDAAQVRGSSG